MLQRTVAKELSRTLGIGLCLSTSLVISLAAAQQPKPPLSTKAVPAPPPAQGVKLVAPQVQFQVMVNGQVVGGAGRPVNENKETGNQRVKLPVDPRARRKMEEARRFIESQDWQSAVKILQSLLDATEDNFLQETEGDKGRRVSVRAEANRMLSSLPPEGKRFYEQQFGSNARLAFKQAKAKADPQAMADIALKYVHTEAGAEAASWLGSYHLDHGRYIVAALCFERLLSRENAGSELNATTLFKAACAFERAGDAANRDRAWKLFQAKLNQPNERLPSAMRSWDEAKLKDALKIASAARGLFDVQDWRLFMGSPDRTAITTSTSPFLEPSFPPIATAEPGQARQEIEQAAKKLSTQGVPIIPGCHPLIVGELVVFRTLHGISAYHLKTGLKAWDSHSDASLAHCLKTQNQGDPEAQVYLGAYRETAPNILIENTLLGTLSADQELLYAVEDLALPPYVQNYGAPWGGRWNRNNPQIGNRLGEFSNCNRLMAYDLDGGRTVWSIGTQMPDQPFSRMFFLGPPLPLGDKLYVLAEVSAEIKLLCLQNRKTIKSQIGSSIEYEYGVDLVWSQPLGVVDRSITEDPVRRTQAALLAYSDGILICPTNAGSVIGVDLLTRSLVWAYNYQNDIAADQPAQLQMMNVRGRPLRMLSTEPLTRGAQWSFSAPVVSQGKVLLAPSDGTALHVINLRDGTLAWTVNRVDTVSKEPLPPDYYLAGVFGNKVVLVGKQNIHALDLNTGKQLWNTMTGLPCGRGIANDEMYFLPVKGNELLGISLKDGTILTRNKARQKEQLGNLALIGDYFVSLNHYHLMVFPIQAMKERQVAQRLKANPNDPIGLVDRGELRWHKGEISAAITDFRDALKAKPVFEIKTRAESKLSDTLLTLLEQDFNKNESNVAELEQLANQSAPAAWKDEDKQNLLDRKARFYRVVAKGREAQGRIGEALDALQAFAQLDDKMIVNPDDPLVRILPRVWSQAQARAMAERLKPELRTRLDQIIETKWTSIQNQSHPEALKQFVDFYGELSEVGQNAQLVFAEKLMEQKQYAEALLRLLPLLKVQNPVIAARAHDSVARLNIHLGEMENAAYYYRLLAKKHPTVQVRDNKSGLQLYQELMFDKRFLPYLEERQGLSNLQNISIEDLKYVRKYNNQQNSFVANFESVDELPPSLRRYTLQVIADNQNQFRCNYVLRDQLLGKELLTKWAFAFPTLNYSNQDRIWPTFKLCGNILVFSWSNRVIGLDLVNKTEAWSINVLGDLDANDRSGSNRTQVIPLENTPGRFRFMDGTNNISEILGTYGPATSDRLVVTIRHEGLVCINPQTGEKLWTRYGIPTSAELFGDDEYAIVIPYKEATGLGHQTMAVNLHDGQAIPLKNTVEAQYRSALAVRGRHLLLRLPANAGSDDLQLIDPVTSKPVWSTRIDSKSTMVQSPRPGDQFGYLNPQGVFTLFNIQTGKTTFVTKLPFEQKHFEQAHFLIDGDECFLLFCRNLEEKQESGNRRELFRQFQWLRSIPVNGPVVCVNKDNGKLLWHENLPLHYVVIQRFEELPFLLCSSVSMSTKQPVNPNVNLNNGMVKLNIVNSGNGQLVNDLAMYSKLTGKLIPLSESATRELQGNYSGRVNTTTGYQELLIDQQSGKIELRSHAQTLSFLLAPSIVAGNQK